MGRVLSTPTDTRETRATNANHTALSGQILLLDTTVASFTVTLPANPRLGDRINLIDAAGNCGNNKVIVARNGNKIANLAEDLDFDIKNASLELIYTGSAYGWSILSN
jgi:phage tail sheath protein FI